jgi:hypothetical protein
MKDICRRAGPVKWIQEEEIKMTIQIARNISVEEVLRVWESNHGKLSVKNRQSFLRNRDARALTQYSEAQIDRVIRLSKAQYLPDILGILKKWNYKKISEAQQSIPTMIQTRVQVTEYRVKFSSLGYLCGICRSEVVGVSCKCRMVY